MRKFGKRSKPPSPSADAAETTNPQNWLTVSQIVKVLVTSGVLLFVCNLCYDAAKATILRRLQLEAENKQLRLQLERIDQKIIPKIEQAHHDVKDIQHPLEQEKLAHSQMQQLALKARGVCETLEEVEHLLKLNTVAAADKAEELELAEILIGVSNAKAAPANDKKDRFDKRSAGLESAPHGRDELKASGNIEESRVSRKFDPHSAFPGLQAAATSEETPALRNPQQPVDAGAPLLPPNPTVIARNLAFLGLPELPESREPADIRRVILQHKASLQDCYTRILKDHPAVSGEIKVRLTIAPSGKVIAAALLASTTDHPELEQLIVERISRWNDFGEVSPSVGNVTFRQTFILGEEKLLSRN